MAFKSWMVGIAAILTVNSVVTNALGADSVYLKSTHGVNPIGAFTQNIPIEIPPGTAGLQPSISLSYNSQVMDGLVGKGWSISGMSIISRCPATIDQDGKIGGVNLDSNDKFCLDGMKLLAVSGGYGADGTEYRAETESFSRIFSHVDMSGELQYFSVIDRFGKTSFYGNYDGNEAYAAIVGPNNPNTPFIWALSRVQDLENNYYTITYVNNSSQGEYHPTEIDYTGNSTTGASTSPYNSIKFVYSSRFDNSAIYRSDTLMQNTSRITEIQTFANGAGVLNYILNYSYSGQSGNSLLRQVNPESADGTASLLPITINWNEPSGSYATSIGVPALIPSTAQTVSATYTTGGVGSGNSGSGIFNLMTASENPLTGDFNGDGSTDFVQLSGGMSSIPVCFSNISSGGGFTCTNYAITVDGAPFTFPNTAFATFVTGDFDGDGLTDIAQLDTASGTETICYSQGDGHFDCHTSTAFPVVTNGQYMIGDFNGDGLTDILIYGVYPNNALEVCLSTTDRTTMNNCTPVTPSGFTNLSTGPGGAIQFLVGDFDGDGQLDFAELREGGDSSATICYSNWSASGTFDCESKTFPLLTADTTDSNWFVGDFNGDGLTDIALFSSSGAYICSSVGRGQSPLCCVVSMSPVTITSGLGAVNNANPFAVVDLNGDGKSDIITQTADGSSWQLCYSGSDGSMHCTTVPKASGLYVTVGGFTGDGTTSILSFDPTTSTSVNLAATPSVYPDLITSIQNGLGALTTISYAPLTNKNIYTLGPPLTVLSPPVSQNVQNTAYVVTALNEPNGIGGTHSITYQYTGALRDLGGRGFLGFSLVTQQDLTSNQQTLTYYNQTYPLTGYPSVVQTSIHQGSSWNLADEKDYTYTIDNLDGTTRDFVYLATEVDQQYDFVHSTLASTATTNNVYDTYGNLTSSTMITGDGYRKVTTNTFAAPGSIWYLGQLTTSQQYNTIQIQIPRS